MSIDDKSRGNKEENVGMKTPHVVLTRIIVLVFVGLWVVIPIITFLTGTELILWHCFMAAIVLSVAISCIHVLRPDRMIVAVFLGEVYNVYAREAPTQGICNTGIVWVFPPVINRAIYLPISVFTVPFQSSAANTKEEKKTNEKDAEPLVPVTVFQYLQLRLKPDVKGIRKFLEALPILQEYRPDLTTPHDLDFFTGINSSGVMVTETRQCPCIAAILLRELSSTVNEGVGRTIPDFPLSSALKDLETIEKSILEHFSKTIFTEAALLTDDGDPGAAVALFDFNVMGILPTNPDAAKALSAEITELKLAKGAIEKAKGAKKVRKLEGEGEKAYLTAVASTAITPEGRMALAATTLQKLPANTTLVAGPDIVTAVASKLLTSSTSPPVPGQPTP